jgi:hypothetical protein
VIEPEAAFETLPEAAPDIATPAPPPEEIVFAFETVHVPSPPETPGDAPPEITPEPEFVSDSALADDDPAASTPAVPDKTPVLAIDAPAAFATETAAAPVELAAPRFTTVAEPPETDTPPPDALTMPSFVSVKSPASACVTFTAAPAPPGEIAPNAAFSIEVATAEAEADVSTASASPAPAPVVIEPLFVIDTGPVAPAAVVTETPKLLPPVAEPATVPLLLIVVPSASATSNPVMLVDFTEPLFVIDDFPPST